MIITPETRVEVPLSNGRKVFIKPITAKNIQAVFDLASLQDKLANQNFNFTPEETEKLLNVVKVSVVGWVFENSKLEKPFNKETFLDEILFPDLISILKEVVELNFREPGGAAQNQVGNEKAGQ